MGIVRLIVGMRCGAMVLIVAAGAVLAEESTISQGESNAEGFLVHRVESPLQAGPTAIRVLLPDRTETGVRYPVLYVLPVEAGDGRRYGDGLVECRHCDPQSIWSHLRGTTFSDLPWYADHPSDPGIRQESYLLNVIVPFVDQTYPTIAEPKGRWLVGFSKSGWGAFSLLLRHLDTFGKAAAWDAPLMKERPDQFGMGPIFGTQENFERYEIAELLKREAVHLHNGARLVHLGYGNFRDHHEQCEKLLTELHVSHRYADGPQAGAPVAQRMAASSCRDARQAELNRVSRFVEVLIGDRHALECGGLAPLSFSIRPI